MLSLSIRLRAAFLPLLLTVGALGIFNFQFFRHILRVETQLGQYVYPLDDSYIHLAIARNVAKYSTWGITRHAYSNTSSSPIYTTLLAGIMRLTGTNPSVSLYLNLCLANLLLLTVAWRHRKRPLALGLLMIFLLAGSLLKVQTLTGMEPALQMLVLILLALSFSVWGRQNFGPGRAQKTFFFILPFVCLTRFELTAPALMFIIFLILKRKFRQGAMAVVLLALPPVLWGLYSLSRGEFFVPNALISKVQVVTQPRPLWGYASDALRQTVFTPIYSYPLLLLWFLVIAKRNEETDASVRFVTAALSFTALLTLLAHLMLGGRGVLFRYEAYLVALIGWACAESMPSPKILVRRPFFLFILTATLIFSALAFYRNYLYHNTILSLAHRNIRDQQLQAAAFVKRHYAGGRIVANDIGALCYENDIQLFDLVGLGTAPMLKAWLKGPETAEGLINSQPYDLMLMYERWFPHIHFANRQKVAELIIPRNVICGDSVVAFYIPANVTDESTLKKTFQSLHDFKNTLPAGVRLMTYDSVASIQSKSSENEASLKFGF